jgi:2-C-methyl-D-erythritol 2,4-cyclodiphosphate synthase
MRVGSGIDVHRFGGSPPVILGGQEVDGGRGLEATSDGDVVLHALIDALLGATALGDLGDHFPSSNDQWQGAASIDLLRRTVRMIAEAGYVVVNADVTVVSQSVRIAPHRDRMRTTIASALGIGVDAVSVKATSTDHIGMIGRDEGIAAIATVLVGPAQSSA